MGRQDTTKLENTIHTIESDNTEKSHKDFPLAPSIKSDSIGGAEPKMFDCQESYQIPTSD